jgi:hypothetical protein
MKQSLDGYVFLGDFSPLETSRITKLFEAFQSESIEFSAESDDTALKNQRPHSRPGSFGADVKLSVYVKSEHQDKARTIVDNIYGVPQI